MNKIQVTLLITALAGASALGQGAVPLAPVPVTNGLTGMLAGPQVMAELFGGPFGAPEGSLTQLVSPIALSGGYASFGSVTVPFALGSTIELQIRAWDDASGVFPDWAQAQPAWLAGAILGGESQIVDALVQGGTEPGPQIIVPGFTITQIPEPSAAALGFLALCLWQARRVKPQL